MKNRIKDTGGFAIIELVIIIVVVAVLGVAGYFIWSHNKGSSESPLIAHAGSYNYKEVYSFKGPDHWYNFFGCKQTVANGMIQVNTLANIFPPLPASKYNGNYTWHVVWENNKNAYLGSPYQSHEYSAHSWWVGQVSSIQFQVSPNTNNFLYFVTPSNLGTSGTFRAGDLPQC